jgi:hypothetical protein
VKLILEAAGLAKEPQAVEPSQTNNLNLGEQSKIALPDLSPASPTSNHRPTENAIIKEPSFNSKTGSINSSSGVVELPEVVEAKFKLKKAALSLLLMSVISFVIWVAWISQTSLAMKHFKEVKCSIATMKRSIVEGERAFEGFGAFVGLNGIDVADRVAGDILANQDDGGDIVAQGRIIDAKNLKILADSLKNALNALPGQSQASDYEYTGLDLKTKILSPKLGETLNSLIPNSVTPEAILLNNIANNLSTAAKSFSTPTPDPQTLANMHESISLFKTSISNLTIHPLQFAYTTLTASSIIRSILTFTNLLSIICSIVLILALLTACTAVVFLFRYLDSYGDCINDHSVDNGASTPNTHKYIDKENPTSPTSPTKAIAKIDFKQSKHSFKREDSKPHSQNNDQDNTGVKRPDENNSNKQVTDTPSAELIPTKPEIKIKIEKEHPSPGKDKVLEKPASQISNLQSGPTPTGRQVFEESSYGSFSESRRNSMPDSFHEIDNGKKSPSESKEAIPIKNSSLLKTLFFCSSAVLSLTTSIFFTAALGSTMLSVGMAATCFVMDGVLGSKGFVADKLNKSKFYKTDYAPIVDHCVAADGDGDLLAASDTKVDQRLLETIDALQTIFLYKSYYDSMSTKNITEATLAIGQLTEMVTMDSDANINDIEYGIKAFNNNKCLQDEFHYTNNCPPGFTISKNTDDSNTSLNSAYCIQPTTIPGDKLSTRYTSNPALACKNNPSNVEAQELLTQLISMIEQYRSNTNKLSQLLQDVSTSSNSVLSALVDSSTSNAVNLLSSNKFISAALDSKIATFGGSTALTNCRFMRRSILAIQNVTCFKLFKRIYGATILSFILGILLVCTVISGFMSYRYIDAVEKLQLSSDNTSKSALKKVALYHKPPNEI